MTKPLLLALAFFLMVSSSACAQEVAYTYSESGGRPLESGNITAYNGSDMVTSSIAGAGSSLGGAGMTVEEMKREINLKLNVGNPRVRDEGMGLILDYPGDGTINQISSIYEHMVGNWSYARDTRGKEVLQYSNQSLDYGKERFSGQGDCDDFAILLASLIESVGGTSRIVLAYGPNSGHAYTEVYLGKAGGPESDVQRMLSWLRKKYGVEVINTHTDLKTGDVWLNLDWWKDPNTGRDRAMYPGGPFFSATSQVPIPTREKIPPQPLKPVNEPPDVLFTISPEMPDVGWEISFNASKSRDIGGKIETYEWDFGDGNKSDKMSQPILSHIYSKGGAYIVILTLEDDEGATNSSSRDIVVNNPPQANFTITPPNPKVGDQAKFDASESYDSEDGRSLQYYWEINNGSAIFYAVSPPKLTFEEPGMYWINLTVTDKNGAERHKNVLLKINQPPIPRINFDNASLNLGMTIDFSAAASEDIDGKIAKYAWDFGDNSEIDHNITALHIYNDGGEKIVRLTVEDNDGAKSNISQAIFINRLPIAQATLKNSDYGMGTPMTPTTGIRDSSEGIQFVPTESNGQSNALINWVIPTERRAQFRSHGTIAFMFKADRKNHTEGEILGENYGLTQFNYGQGTFGAACYRIANGPGVEDDQFYIRWSTWHNGIWQQHPPAGQSNIILEYDRWYDLGFAWGGPANSFEIWVCGVLQSEDSQIGATLPWGDAKMGTGSGTNIGLGDNHERTIGKYGSASGVTFADIRIWDEYREYGDTELC